VALYNHQLPQSALKSKTPMQTMKDWYASHPHLFHKRPYDRPGCDNALVLSDPIVCEGHARQVDRFLRQQDQEPLIAQRVATFDVMMTLVSAGLALGLAGAAHIAASREPGVVGRPLEGKPPMLTTYLLRRDAEPSETLARFIERVHAIQSPEGSRPAPPPQSNTLEEIEP